MTDPREAAVRVELQFAELRAQIAKYKAVLEAGIATLEASLEADPREDWRCGTCAHWEKRPGLGAITGECLNREAMGRVWARRPGGPEYRPFTFESFGCRFWSVRPVVSDVGKERRTLEYTSDDNSLAAMLGGGALRP